MPNIFIPSQEGRLEAKYHDTKGPVSLLLHAHPLFSGNMNNQIMYQLYWELATYGNTVVRFNFRGVGQSEGEFSGEDGELSDANTVLDWAMAAFPGREFNVIGFSFGAWVGANLSARRPEIKKFVAISPPVGFYSFGFMTEFCSAKCLFVVGTEDNVVSVSSVAELLFVLRAQNSQGDFLMETIEGANHFFDESMKGLVTTVRGFIDSEANSPAS